MIFRQLATLACFLVSLSDAVYRPVVMMHGLMQNHTHVQRNEDAVRAAYPGIYVTSLAVYDGIFSLANHMNQQLAAVVAAIQNDPNLAQGFNFYGESQGALLARAYVTTVNSPPVFNLVALNGPQNGVGECPKVELPVVKQLCGDLGAELDIYHWPACSFCSYWRGKDKKKYFDNSEFLADVNNEDIAGGVVNQTRRQNMMSLNKYMATAALRDTVVQPGKSAWHTFWHWGDRWRTDIMDLNETTGYQNDVLGLKTLDQRHALILNSFDSHHLGYTMDWWNETVLPMFNNKLDPSPFSYPEHKNRTSTMIV